MKKILMMMSLLTMSLTHFALAHGDKGNGGDARMIEGKYYSLDLVELGLHKTSYIDENADYSMRINKYVDSSFPNKEFDDLRERIKNKLGEIERIDPIAAYSIVLAAKSYTWAFLYDVELIELYDEFSNVIGENIQVGIRQNRLIQVNANIFLELDTHNKIAFIFHELISALSKGKTLIEENTKARLLTGSLFNYDLITSGDNILRKIICDTIPCLRSSEKADYVYVRKGFNYYSNRHADFISTPKSIKLMFQSINHGYVNYVNTLSLSSLFEKDFNEKACVKAWDSIDSSSKPKVDFTFQAHIMHTENSKLYSLNFYDHDYTFWTWSNNSKGTMYSPKKTLYMSDEYKLLFKEPVIAHRLELVTENVCVEKRRNGKCKRYEEQQIERKIKDREVFMKDCKDKVQVALDKQMETLLDEFIKVDTTF